MRTTRQPYLHCPLCGFEFEKRDTPCAQGCPLGRFCSLVCCPNCRYEFPEQSQSIGWLHRLFHRTKPARARGDSVALPELDEGEQGELVCLNCAHASRRNALAVYGLVPGSRVVLQQKRPTFVVRVGETELALEADIAREILVRRLRTRAGKDALSPPNRGISLEQPEQLA
ncbi:MAG TPA: FeoA family protein [Verrucomicrobiae bacterium]|nr:FeoA family protein [Verrucomicrobiae bacterium]